MNNIEYIEEGLSPREETLRSFLGRSINKMIKCSYENFSEHVEYLKICGIEDNTKETFFKIGYGLLLIVFDNNEEYAFNSDEELNSVIFWFIKRHDSILNDNNLKICVSVDELKEDSNYNEMLNTKIKQINILTTTGLNAKEQGLLSEKGIEFIFENEKKLILSHNLTSTSFVFSVLCQDDKLIPETFIKKSYFLDNNKDVGNITRN